MSKRRIGLVALELLAIALFLLFLFPFFIVVVNSAKEPFEITQNPLSLPTHWGKILQNMALIWTSPNIQYASSFASSIIITAASLVLINLFGAQAAWVLVRTKTRLSWRNTRASRSARPTRSRSRGRP